MFLLLLKEEEEEEEEKKKFHNMSKTRSRSHKQNQKSP